MDKVYKELESLGFFDWLEQAHNLKDTDVPPDYLDNSPIDDIHRTVINAAAFRWFREKYFYDIYIKGTSFRASYVIGIPTKINPDSWDGHPLVISWDYIIDKTGERKTYPEAELDCVKKLIEIVKNKTMNIEYLKNFCKEKSLQYPELKSKIEDFYSLALDEIEEGGSEPHEVELTIDSINSLIN